MKCYFGRSFYRCVGILGAALVLAGGNACQGGAEGASQSMGEGAGQSMDASTVQSDNEGVRTSGGASEASSFTVRVVCESSDIYQLYYTCYIDGEEYSMGGWADLDGGAITETTDMTMVGTREYFEGQDISRLSMDFSPYGEGDTSEIATTEPVLINAEYGNTYTIIFSGDAETGFTATLQDGGGR